MAALVPVVGTGQLARAQSRSASSVVDGVVSDTNLVTLPDAIVSILGSSIRVVTGGNGRFRINRVPSGQYIVVVHHVGYLPSTISLQVADNDTLRMSVMLRPITTALDTVVVVARAATMRMAEFEERRKFGFGYFLTQSEIESRNAVRVVDLIRSIPSLRIEETPFSQAAFSLRSITPCPLQVFVNGVLLAPETPPPPPPPPKGRADLARTPPPASNLFNLPPPKDIAGIEVYTGAATIPLQYKRADSGCGIILIWTK